jgi:hypothetical protein
MAEAMIHPDKSSWGFRVDGDGKLVPDLAEQVIIAEMITLRGEARRCGRLAAALPDPR